MYILESLSRGAVRKASARSLAPLTTDTSSQAVCNVLGRRCNRAGAATCGQGLAQAARPRQLAAGGASCSTDQRGRANAPRKRKLVGTRAFLLELLKCLRASYSALCAHSLVSFTHALGI